MKKKRFSTHPPAVVVGLNVTGLGVVRSLTKKCLPIKIPITGVDSNLKQPCALTRLCDKFFCEDLNSEILVDRLLDLRSRFSRNPVLYLSTDATVLSVSQHRDQLKKHYRFLLPDTKVTQLLLNKARFFPYVQRNGFNIPRSFEVHSIEEMQTALASIRFPCILKPCYRTSQWEIRGYPKQYVFDNKTDLLRVYNTVRLIQSDYLLQEWVEGKGADSYFCLVCYDENSHCIGSFTGKKLRQWPHSSGNACIAIPADCPEVEKETKRLFDSLHFKGFGSLEFKRDCRTGEYKILEATVGRTNFHSEIATANGINLVWKAYANLTQIKAEPKVTVKSSTIWIYEYGDIRASLQQFRRGELTYRSWIKTYKGRKCYALFSLKDPFPLLTTFASVLKRMLKVRLTFWKPQEKVIGV